jgi:hypothetical protein
MKDIKGIVNRVIQPIAKKHGIVHGKIILDWEKIVGPQYAQYCSPTKVTFRQGYRTFGTLHLKVNPSHALLVSHSKDLVLEKINTFFGYKALSDLRMIQVPFTPRSPIPEITVKKKSPTLVSKETFLSPKERLFAALSELGNLVNQAKK